LLPDRRQHQKVGGAVGADERSQRHRAEKSYARRRRRREPGAQGVAVTASAPEDLLREPTPQGAAVELPHGSERFAIGAEQPAEQVVRHEARLPDERQLEIEALADQQIDGLREQVHSLVGGYPADVEQTEGAPPKLAQRGTPGVCCGPEPEHVDAVADRMYSRSDLG